MYVPTVIIIALASLTIAAPGTLLDTAAPIMGRMESHEIRDAARGTGSKSGNTQGGGGKTQGGGSQMQGGGGQTQSGTGKTQGGGKPFTGIATFNRYADQTNTVCGPMKGTYHSEGFYLVHAFLYNLSPLHFNLSILSFKLISTPQEAKTHSVQLPATSPLTSLLVSVTARPAICHYVATASRRSLTRALPAHMSNATNVTVSQVTDHGAALLPAVKDQLAVKQAAKARPVDKVKKLPQVDKVGKIP